MALRKQTISILLGKGVDARYDPKVVPDGVMADLENADLGHPGRVSKRTGHSALSVLRLDGTTKPVGHVLATKGGELDQLHSGSLDAYVPSQDRWVNRGDRPTLLAGLSSVVASTDDKARADFAFSGSVGLAVWENLNLGGCWYEVFDADTGAIYRAPSEFYHFGQRPRAAVIRNAGVTYLAAVVAVSGANVTTTGSLLGFRMDPASPTAGLGTGSWITQDFKGTDAGFDVAQSGSATAATAYPKLFYTRSGSAGLTYDNYTVASLDHNLVLSNRNDFRHGQGINFYSSPSVAVSVNDQTGDYALAYGVIYAGGAGSSRVTPIVDHRSFTSATGSKWAEVAVSASIISTTQTNQFEMRGVGVTFTSTTGTYVFAQVARTGSDSRGAPNQTKLGQNYTFAANLIGGAVTPDRTFPLGSGTFLANSGLASAPWTRAGNAECLFSFDGHTQPTYFVARQDRQLVSRILPSQGGLSADSASLPHATVTGTALVLPVLRQGFSTQVTGTVTLTTTPRDVWKAVLRPYDTYQTAEFDDELLVPGPYLMSYDGANLFEHGFLLSPSASLSTILTGSTIGGTNTAIAYTLTYEWTDAQGILHLGRPMVPLVLNVTASAGTIALNVFHTPMSMRTGSQAPLVRVWRTMPDDSVFFLCSSNAQSLALRNDITASGSFLFVDTTPDSHATVTLDDFQQLYSQPDLVTGLAGVKPHDPAPACRDVFVARGRAWLTGLDDPLVVQFSNVLLDDAVAASFPATHTIKLPSLGGRVTAVGEIDDNVIIFKEDAVYRVSGVGPDPLGQGGFTRPELVSAEVGCTVPRSLVSTPEGLFFVSRRGLYLLSKDLLTAAVGRKTEGLADSDVRSGDLLPGRSVVRFLGRTGPSAERDYLASDEGEWSVSTNVTGSDAVVWNSSYTYLQPDGRVLNESTGSYTDAGASYPLVMETGWIHPGSVQGYQSVESITILGDWESGHTLTGSVAYDFRPNWVSQHFWARDLNSTGSLYQFQIPRSKLRSCQAFKLRLQEGSGSIASGAPGPAYTLTEIRMDVWVDDRPPRLQGSRR